MLPQWTLGEWTGLTDLDGRLVAWLPCDAGPELLTVGDGGAVRWKKGGDILIEDQATDVQLGSDLSVTLPLRGGGSLALSDEDNGVMLVSGSRPSGSEARRFAQLSAPGAIEVVVEPAGGCGGSPDTRALSGIVGPFNQTGDPCAAAGLLVELGGPVPKLHRAGAEYRIQAVQARWDGTLLTLEQGGKLLGIWLEQRPDGTVVVHQSGPSGMASETLRSAAGICRGERTTAPRKRPIREMGGRRGR
ncbi:MAG: hypothetical protein H6742_03560 [Alphaproteobacteria bacterium]|nr:hypothetical protein [Alphaproteobacteria bacterium]